MIQSHTASERGKWTSHGVMVVVKIKLIVIEVDCGAWTKLPDVTGTGTMFVPRWYLSSKPLHSH